MGQPPLDPDATHIDSERMHTPHKLPDGQTSNRRAGIDALREALGGQARALAELGQPEGYGRFTGATMVARGGMGAILEARDPDLRRTVALKVMLSGPGASEGERQKFLSEARITSQLEHPNIVPVHELGVDAADQQYFCMKLVRGKSLADVLYDLADDGTAAVIAARIGLLNDFLKICDGVAFAHSKGVIHRDLKPANVMTGEFGEVLVMDWGLAKVLGQPETQGPSSDSSSRAIDTEQDPALATLDGDLFGTPAYMSPEQASSRWSTVDARSDIHALGGILYTILTLEPPYSGIRTEELIAQARRGEVVPPTRAAPSLQIPYELEAVAMKAMAPEATARYGTVELMQADIVAYLEGRVLSAAHYNPVQLVIKWVRRYKGLVGAVLLLLFVITSALVRVTQERNKAVAARKRIAARISLEKYQRKIVETRSYFYVKEIDLLKRLAELDQALTELETLSKKPAYRDDPLLWRLLGIGSYYLGRPHKAEAALRKAANLSPQDLWVRYYLGRIYIERGFVIQLKGGRSNVNVAAHLEGMEVMRKATQEFNSQVTTWEGAREIDRHLVRTLLASSNMHKQEKTMALCKDGVARFAGQFGVENYWVLMAWRSPDHKIMLERFDKALRIRPHDAMALVGRAYARQRLGDLPGAERDLTRALKIIPRSEVALSNRGVIRRMRNKFQAAMADFDTAIEIDPSFAAAFNNRAMVYYDTRRYAEAAADCLRAIALKPRLATAHSNLGLAYRKLGRLAEAETAVGEAIKLRPKSGHSYYERALVRFDRKNAKGGVRDLSQVIRLNPRHEQSLYLRGKVYVQNRYFNRGIADLSQAIQLSPAVPVYYFERAIAYRRSGRRVKALADFGQAIKLGPTRAEYRYERAVCHELMRNGPKALADLDQAIKLDPKHGRALLSRGTARERLGNPRGALADYRGAAKHAGDYIGTWIHLGSMLAKLGKTKGALTALRKALSMAPPPRKRAQLEALIKRLEGR